MKKIVLAIMALTLMVSCAPKKSFVQEQMEAYAKSHISNPESFKFSYMGIEKEYRYINDLYTYRKGLEKQAEKAADKAPWEAEMAKVDRLFDEFADNPVACYEYSLYFKCIENDTPVERVVLSRYDADSELLVMTLDPDSLPTYPALQMLRDQGKL